MTYMPPLPIEPTDAKAIEALAGDTHRKNIEVTQDVGRITGWLAAIVRWPFRQLLRIARR